MIFRQFWFFSKFLHLPLILLISLQGYLYSLSTLMVYMVYGVYVTIRDGCVSEIQSTVDEGDFFGTVKNGCICNPWVAFAGKIIYTPLYMDPKEEIPFSILYWY